MVTSQNFIYLDMTLHIHRKDKLPSLGILPQHLVVQGSVGAQDR